MNVVKLDLFCPACGVFGICVDKDEAGDYYAGTTHYCFSCHTSLPDLKSVKKGDILSTPLNDWERKQYLSIRNAAGIETKR